MCLTNDGGNRANRLGGDPNWYTSARNMMFSSATCDDLSASSRSDDTYSMDRPPPLSFAGDAPAYRRKVRLTPCGLGSERSSGAASTYLTRHAISGSKSPIVLLFGKMTLKSARSFEYKG
jgi:hypothetical protein